MHTGFWCVSLKERGHLEHLSTDGRILKHITKKQDGRTWNEFMWLRRGTSGRLVNMVTSMISGFPCDADKICALLGYYAMESGNSVQTFRDNISLTSSRVKRS
jgi:hypothetical protein